MTKSCNFPERGHPDFEVGPDAPTYPQKHGWCPACRLEAQRRYKHSEKGRAQNRKRMKKWRRTERGREVISNDNQRRVRLGSMYLGLGGFTLREREELLRHGTPH